MVEDRAGAARDAVSLISLVENMGVAWCPKKTRRDRHDFYACCPFHEEGTPSFHVYIGRDGRERFKCFGCGVSGTAIDFVMLRDGISDVGEAIRRLSGAPPPRTPLRAPPKPPPKDDRTRERIERIWAEALPDDPRLAVYLMARGVRIEAIGGIPETLRLHPDLPCFDEGAIGAIWSGPAMIGSVGRGSRVGLHRTWISATGRARFDRDVFGRRGEVLFKAGDKVPKQFLGTVYGHPVVLTSAGGDQTVMVAEGIETALAAAAASAHRGFATAAEAALSLDALAGPGDPAQRGPGVTFNGRPLPSPSPLRGATNPGWMPGEEHRHVVILADPSSRCPESARRHADRALAKVVAAGRSGRVTVPLGRWDHDLDFADLAQCGDLYGESSDEN